MEFEEEPCRIKDEETEQQIVKIEIGEVPCGIKDEETEENIVKMEFEEEPCSIKDEETEQQIVRMKFEEEPRRIKDEETEQQIVKIEFVEEPCGIKDEETEEQIARHEEASAEADSDEERMRKLRLEEFFASLDADFQTGVYTEELDDNNNRLLDDRFCLQDSEEGRGMRADDATCVPEDDSDEDGDDVCSGFQDQFAAKVPQLGKPCGPTCRKKCMTKIPEDQRRRTFEAYWNMSYGEKRSFVFHMVSQRQTMRHTSAVPSRRSRSLSYHLIDDLGQQQEVCKKTFLTTLGYHPKNDRLIVTVIGNTIPSSLTPPRERRGKHPPINKIDMTPIYEHIELFNPTSCPYRCRRYLPSDVNIQLMFRDYKERKSLKCSYETYRKAIKERNISFTKLGEEECEDCSRHDVHVRAEHQTETSVQDCHHCQMWDEHKKRAEGGRHHYMLDAEREELDDLSVRRLDRQKVIMLPRMPGTKTALFTQRISAFHETFANVGKKSSFKKNSISVIWHEGIAGRKVEEVASAFVTALRKERDVKHIIYWVDTCTAQNWCLLTTLVTVVNDPTTTLEDITIKYFEPGHTFISADSFHHGVEKEMRKRPGGAVLDYEDFKNVIASSNSGKVSVVEIQSRDILAWRAGHSLAKLKTAPDLSNIAVIQLRRGSREMFFKLSHDEEEFAPLDFLMDEVTLEYPKPLRPGDKGIEREKKSNIVSNLCPMMPLNRRHFWENLAEEE